MNLKEQYCGHEPKSNSLAYCDIICNKIVTVEEKLNVNLMKFRKIVIDGNLWRQPETQQSGRNSCLVCESQFSLFSGTKSTFEKRKFLVDSIRLRFDEVKRPFVYHHISILTVSMNIYP